MDVTPDPSNNDLPDPELTVNCNDSTLSITTNGIPNHPIGQFPNPANPNPILAQDDSYSLSLAPAIADNNTTLVIPNPFGIAINGVVFDPLAAEWWNNDPNSGWNYNALSDELNLGLDKNNAHVQPDGTYHYHGLPVNLAILLNQGEQLTLIGYAADGFPIYYRYGYSDPNDTGSNVILLQSSYQLKSGTRPSGPGGEYDGTFVEDYEYVEDLGDLDECNGRFGITPEYPAGIYHYYLTDEFPVIPRCFVGTPDPSFIMDPPPPPAAEDGL